MSSPRRAPRRSTCRWSPAVTVLPSLRRTSGACGSISTCVSARLTNASPNSNARNTLSTGVRWRTTATFRPCKRQWWRLEGSREFDARVDALREKKAGLRRTYRYRAGVIREEIERIAGLQEAERRKQKKLEKSYEDFMKLLTFVETVEDDDFWRSEVVQITAKTTPSGALEVELTPRSGRFAVLFGRLEDVERKFDKLLRFYRSGLSSIGWSEYRTIDIRYNDQVVCKK